MAPRSTARQAGDETRTRIMLAALDTLREEGISGTTARAIAARGGFNQALIFYHFGTVANLLAQAAAQVSARQAARYREASAGVRSLADLVGIARALHHDDLQSGSVAVVTQLMAAAVSDPELATSVLGGFEEWIGLVEEALGRAVESSPMASLIPPREAAYAISAMFLGIELMERLDPERSEAERVFDVLETLARTVEGLFGGSGP